ncbi:MAG TPA: prepilin-type N-terminal cleavage/methylation domain-containing protein [Candidatus Paceibacterota bacterium]
MKNKKGITLIETLIYIALLSILMSGIISSIFVVIL